MILSKTDLKQYIEQDDVQFAGQHPGLMSWLLKNENWYIRQYKYHLRWAEYCHNVPGAAGGGLLRKFVSAYHRFRYERLGAYLHYSIKLNTCGPGLQLFHSGARIAVKHGTTLGADCTLLEGVVFGKKTGEGEELQQVGDHCFFGTGTKVLGELTIGHHVTVGANSVVTHSLPDYAVAAGAPAHVIRIDKPLE